MPFAVSPLLKLISGRNSMSNFDFAAFEQLVKNPIASRNIESKFKLFLPAFNSRFQRGAYVRLIFTIPNKFSGIDVVRFIIRAAVLTLNSIDVVAGRPLNLFASAFTSRSTLV